MLCYVTGHQHPVTTEQREHAQHLCPIAKQACPRAAGDRTYDEWQIEVGHICSAM